MSNLPSGTVTFLFTDIEGSTKLAREHAGTWEKSRARHHQILREAIESNNGFVFQVIGDAFCAAFHTAGDALQAAIKAQQSLQDEAWGECVIRARMGIHTGEAQERDKEYTGYLTLSLVQRLMSAGHGGQVLVSGITENLLRGQLPNGIKLRDLGKQAFRDVLDPIRVFQVMAPDLRTEFPPLRSIPSHPNNLPTQLTSFVGREKELAEVQKLLLDTHILTLIGPGGTGKTRLSIQAASALLDRFPDGLWLVELAPILDPLLVPRVTATTMGLRDEPQRPVIDMLCDYLREKKMLILLDNCEHLVDACAHMADRILHAAPDVRILASSREALGIGGEVTYRVPSLDLPDIGHLPSVESMSQYEAVKLFIDRARAAVTTFSVTNENAPAVAQICYRLDGIPLAIELAAAKIRVLGIEQIARRLDDRFRLLTGGSRTALERHQTLRAAIDWSYNLLPSAEQVLFRRLSVFIGGWTLEAAEFICQSESVKSEDILSLLEQLINKSLVSMDETQAEPRYSMLETIRQYANEKLVEAGESDALRDRHLDYFLDLAEAAEPHLVRPEQLEWLAKLDADYENVRLALEWASGREPAAPSLRLCAAMGKFWVFRGYWMEGAKWLAGALAKPSQNDAESIWRVKALCQDADIAEMLDDLDQMKSSAELCLKLAQEDSYRREIAIARFFVGFFFFRQENYDQAQPVFEQSISEFQKLHDLYWEAYSYRWLRGLKWNRGDPEILDYTVRSLELARKAGERVNLARALIDYAVLLLFAEGRPQEAKKYLDEALELSEQIGSNSILSDIAEIHLAHIELFDGNRQQARTLFLDAQARSRLLGSSFPSMRCSIALGLLSMQEGVLDQAQGYLEEALSSAKQLNLKYDMAFCLMGLGTLFYFQKDTRQSKQHFKEGMSLLRELNTHLQTYLLEVIFVSPYFRTSEHGAKLLGGARSLQANYPAVKDAFLQRDFALAEAQLRASLGETAFEAAFAEGQKLSLEEALNLAQDMIEAM